MPDPDLLSLVRVAGTAVPVAVAVTALGANPRSIMATGQKLVASGHLVETAEGYTIAEGAAVEVSPTVAAYLSGKLADALIKKGGDPAITGRLLITSGRPAEAWDVLGAAALDDSVKRSDPEQLRLLDLALYALDRAQLNGGSLAAEVRVNLARLSRAKGDTAVARDAISEALPSLAGVHLVDGLGFAAAIADDLQLPQEAERWVALAAMSAADLGLMSKLGSLLTFHGRELSRLGFATEAQAVMSKGDVLLQDHGSEVQRFYAALNQAWVDLDQGQMRKAEAGFARLRDQAMRIEGEASLADKDAYWARSLFGVGRPDQALGAIERAVSLAATVEAAAPEFIAAMAQAEGGALYEQWDYAEAGASKVVELADVSLPSWKNVGFYLAARALAGTGQTEAARSALTAALGATPEGSNGIRWRARIEAQLMALADTWDSRRAEDLTDLLLQSQWLGAAVELMIVRATRDKDAGVAAEAAALAMEIGNPALAAQAIRAGKLWRDPIAIPVIAALRSIKENLPAGWEFMTDPAAEAALASVTEASPEDTALLRARIDDAMEAAGLTGDMILSPAQRRASGQVRRRRRPWSPLRILASAGAAVAIAVLSAVAVVNLTEEPVVTTVTTTAPPTTVFVPTLEETLIPPPESDFSGTVLYRSDAGRSGIASGGFREATGRYWDPVAPGGGFVQDPIAFGRYLYVATEENFIYGIEQLNGRPVFRLNTSTPIISPIAVDQPEGESPPVLVFGGGDQLVYAYSANQDGPELWSHPTVGFVRAAPLIVANNTVYVADTAGYLYAFGLSGGDLLWQYPSAEVIETNGEPEGRFVSAPAFADDIVYAVTEQGLVHLVDAATGLPVCQNPVDLGSGVFTNPVITGGAVFVGLSSRGMSVFAAGTCGDPPTGYAPRYPVPESTVRLSPAITPEVMFYVDQTLLVAATLEASLWENVGTGLPSPWESPFPANDLITTHPVLADGVVYIGTQQGEVIAVDAATGKHLWDFTVGAAVRGEPLAVPGAVFVGNAAGELWAIAGE